MPQNTAQPPFTAACLQTTAAESAEASLREVAALARKAAAKGAKLIFTPENCGGMATERHSQLALASPQNTHEGVRLFSRLAQELRCWIVAGSLAVRVKEEPPSLANRSMLFDDEGQLRATYDKIHLFDADVGDGECHRESALYRPGAKAVCAATPFGVLGMTVCYDLRFPHLFRSLAQNGASLLSVPAAFTRPTGAAHWRTLLRARAIENACFVFAAAQCGDHPCGRRSWGHSLIIDPWGKILAEAGETPDIRLARINPARIREVRKALPSLTHDRPFQPPAPLTATSM